MNVLIRGPLLTQSGYGVHSRQVFRWLLSKGVNVNAQTTPWGITPWYLNKDSLDGLVGEIMSRTGAPIAPLDISFQIQLPDEWDPNVAKINVGITALVETTFCNPDWIQACNKMDAVIVPTNFCKQTLDKTGRVKCPVFVIPESFPDVFLEKTKTSKILNVKTKNNFLLFGQLTSPNPQDDRKNTINAIKWFCEAFDGRKDVGLVIKTNMGTNSTVDKRVSTRTLTNAVQQIRKGKYPKIYLLHGPLEEDQLKSLYLDKSLISLISTTRGEGFGLPMLEAAACGLPVIATNWSGHLDFLNLGDWLPVDYELSYIPESRADGRIFMPGSSWAQPLEEDFKNKLKSILKNKRDHTKRAASLATKIREEFNQEKINSYYEDFFKEIFDA